MNNKPARIGTHYCRKMLRDAGNGVVSKEAVSIFREALQAIAIKICKASRESATVSLRKTITEEDIKTAVHPWFG